jgi:hypothetical protein
MNSIRGDLRKGNQYKCSPVHSRVRNIDCILVNMPIVIQEKIQVYNSRPVARMVRRFPKASLDFGQFVHQLSGREIRFHSNSRVEERASTIGESDGLGLVQS